MSALPLKVNTLRNAEMEYHGKFRQTLGRIHPIDIMSSIGICYTVFCMETETVAPTLTALQGLKRCIQYLAIHPHKTIFFYYITHRPI